MSLAHYRLQRSPAFNRCDFCSWTAEVGDRRVFVRHLKQFHLITNLHAITALVAAHSVAGNGQAPRKEHAV